MGRESISELFYTLIDVIIWIAIVTIFVASTTSLTKITYKSAAQHRENTTIVQIDGTPDEYDGIVSGSTTIYDGTMKGSSVIEDIILQDESITITLEGRAAGFSAVQLEKYRKTADGKLHLTALIDENANYLREYITTSDGTITGINYIKQ